MEKVLVVDDESHILRILKNYLKSEAYDVHTATNGIEAIEKVMEVNPRIVLLDIIMPVMDGMDALKKIKKIKPETAVFMITAVADEEISKRAMELGADGYFTKPIKIDAIGKNIRVKMLELLHDEEKDDQKEEKKK